MFKRFLRNLRNFILRGQREKAIANTIYELITQYHDKPEIKILDYGSGFQPVIARLLCNLLSEQKISVSLDCFDMYEEENLRALNTDPAVRFFHVNDLVHIDKKYDFSIICDTLHHIGIENNEYIETLLTKIKKKSGHMIIKDHFEHGFFSRQCLRCMDFVGNYFNPVRIPQSYYTEHTFNALLEKINLVPIKKIQNIRYYSKKFLFLSNQKLHFIYLL